MIYLDATRVCGGGIGRYIQELIKTCKCYDGFIGKIEELSEFCDKRRIIEKEDFCSNPQKYINSKTIIHFPANDMEDLKEITHIQCHRVLTIHDVIPLVIKETSSRKRERWYQRVKSAADLAELIITVSDCSKKDISEYLDVDEKKITVIYNGISQQFYPLNKLIKERIKDDSKYKIMCTGSFLIHKNFWRCLLAFRFCENYKKSQLLVIKKNKRIYRCIFGVLGMGKKIRLIGGISDEKLNEYYNFADILLFPSLYEGFGMPPLEAMACGTPVICSRSSSLPEIAGDAAYFVNPRDVKDIISAINRIENDEDIRKRLISEGFNKAKEYSWIHTGEKTEECICKLKHNGDI